MKRQLPRGRNPQDEADRLAAESRRPETEDAAKCLVSFADELADSVTQDKGESDDGSPDSALFYYNIFLTDKCGEFFI